MIKHALIIEWSGLTKDLKDYCRDIYDYRFGNDRYLEIYSDRKFSDYSDEGNNYFENHAEPLEKYVRDNYDCRNVDLVLVEISW